MDEEKLYELFRRLFCDESGDIVDTSEAVGAAGERLKTAYQHFEAQLVAASVRVDADKRWELFQRLFLDESDEDSEPNKDLAERLQEAYERFEEQLAAVGVRLDEDECMELFQAIYLHDSDSDEDAEEEEEEEEEEEDDEDEPDADATGEKLARANAGPVGVLAGASRGAGIAQPPSSFGGKGWEQLTRMLGAEKMGKLSEMLKGGAIRMRELDPLDVQLLLSGLDNLQQVGARCGCGVALGWWRCGRTGNRLMPVTGVQWVAIGQSYGVQ
jgi:hypothetical protein